MARAAAFAFAALGLAASADIRAQDLHPPVPPVAFEALRWAGPSADPGALSARPARDVAAPLSDRAALGEILFRSPWILGGTALRLGLSCDTCHPNGHRNARFFFPGASDGPGRFDPTNPIFNPAADDGVFAPLDIPSLRGASAKARFGHDGRHGSLRAFARHAIVVEFAGQEPGGRALDALVAYLEAVGPTDAPDAPARLADDLAVVRRAVSLLPATMEAGEGALAALVVASARSELGRVHERFAGEALADERALLAREGAALGTIAALIEKREKAEALRALALWCERYDAELAPRLLAAEAQTLYDTRRLADFVRGRSR